MDRYEVITVQCQGCGVPFRSTQYRGRYATLCSACENRRWEQRHQPKEPDNG